MRSGPSACATIVAYAPPGELHRRAVRHLGDRLDRFGPLEQPDRAGRGEGCLAHESVSCASDRVVSNVAICRLLPHDAARQPPHRQHREFRDMRVLRHEPRHAAQPEARAEPVDQMRELRRMVAARRGRSARGSQRSVASAPSRITSKPKPGSHSSPITASRSTNSARMRAAIAQRRAGAGLDAMHLAVGAEQRGLQQPRAFAAPFHQRAPVPARDARWCRAHRSSRAIGSAKRCSATKGGHRQARRDRLVLAAERLIDAAHERLPEARGERRARDGRSRRRCVFSPTCASAVRSCSAGQMRKRARAGERRRAVVARLAPPRMTESWRSPIAAPPPTRTRRVSATADARVKALRAPAAA